jgi:hypothetical protein
MVKQLCFWFFIFFSLCSINSQNYPGGVTGAEVWYIADWRFIEDDLYPNQADTDIIISNCSRTEYVNGLLNFNFAIQALKEESKYLCLEYDAPLENTTTRNIFFTSKQEQIEEAYAHLRTTWNQSVVSLPQNNPENENRFDLGGRNSQSTILESSYTSNNNANVNFYRWNRYSADKKHKSYGKKGETEFRIGNNFLFSENLEEQRFFEGRFPEFISFPRELSENERYRVESYLALKYGLTLDNSKDYLSSKNIVFWKKKNNEIFGNRIFGLAKDEISTLNQLQSESVHIEGYLASSIEKLFDTNFEKQNNIEIKNENFLVFGDNGLSNKLGPVLDNGYEIFKRVWLAQSEGEQIREYPIFFRLDIREEILEILKNDEKLKLWLLHDQYVSNDEQSDFNGQHVEYYQASTFDEQYAYFENIFFDTDSNKFDQFTFGIGPEMLVQARLITKDCTAREVNTEIVITGGSPPYDISIEGGLNQDFEEVNENTIVVQLETGQTYNITVIDSNGLTAETTIDVENYDIELDLGPDVILDENQPDVTFDASIDVNTENVTYQWYYNGELLDHSEPTITVSEVGEYICVITTEDMFCDVTDSVILSYQFSGELTTGSNCQKDSGFIDLLLMGGVPNYTTLVEGTSYSQSFVYNTNEYTIEGLNFGTYTLTTNDEEGNQFVETIDVINNYIPHEIDLMAQFELITCEVDYNTNPSYPIVSNCDQDEFYIDASISIDEEMIAGYEWFANGHPLNIFDSSVLFKRFETGVFVDFPQSSRRRNIYTVFVTDLETNCTESQTFQFLDYYIDLGGQNTPIPLSGNDESDIPSSDTFLRSKVFPNPSTQENTFYYNVFSEKPFEATVQVFSTTGNLIETRTISGDSNYTLSYNILSVGVYFIKTISNETIITDKVIIQ